MWTDHFVQICRSEQQQKMKLCMEAIKKILMHENDLELEQHPVKLCSFAIFQSSHFHNSQYLHCQIPSTELAISEKFLSNKNVLREICNLNFIFCKLNMPENYLYNFLKVESLKTTFMKKKKTQKRRSDLWLIEVEVERRGIGRW